MHLFEIRLPLTDNSGKPTRPVHRAYQNWLMDTFGGYSASIFNGAWRDESGAIFYDRNCAYQIASDNEDTPRWLLDRASELFPDQLAFFWARLGTAGIVERDARLAI